MKFTQLDEALTKGRQELAEQARTVLGYTHLADAITIPSGLMFTLRELNIEPLVTRRVVEYKAKKARPGMWSGHKCAFLWGAVSLTLAFGLAPWLNSGLKWNEFSLTALGVVAACVFSVIAMVTSMNYAAREDLRGTRTTRSWGRTSLAGYNRTVPEFALSKALQIKTAIPAVEIVVDYLQESTERIERRMPDPFLLVTLGRETYYIDVWDERDYEKCL